MSKLRFAGVLLAAFTIYSCHKSSEGEESFLYGTWIKGTNAGDTLHFLKKNGRNLLDYNLSFNAALPASTQREYRFRNGKLSVKRYGGSDFDPIESFKWKQLGNEFEIQGIELFNFMSSTTTYFTYHKIP